MLSEAPVVLMAKEADVAHAVIPSHREWMPVVELEAQVLEAASPLLVDEAATRTIPLGDRSAHCRGNVPGSPGRVGFGERAARLRRLAESARFECSSFSVTARSMTAARSPLGTSDRMRAASRSILSRSVALAVNWIL
jgi:hypothetical protein